MGFSDDPKSVLIEHLRNHAVRTDGPFVLRSGRTSDWYIDARQTTFSGDGALAVGRAVLTEVPTDVVAVGGMTMGADPLRSRQRSHRSDRVEYCGRSPSARR